MVEAEIVVVLLREYSSKGPYRARCAIRECPLVLSMRTMRAFVAAALILLALGCGTIEARKDGPAFGFPVYAGTRVTAVYGYLLTKMNPPWVVLALVSLPFDLALDTVFLPLDLGAGLGGRRLRLPPHARSRGSHPADEPGEEGE